MLKESNDALRKQEEKQRFRQPVGFIEYDKDQIKKKIQDYFTRQSVTDASGHISLVGLDAALEWLDKPSRSTIWMPLDAARVCFNTKQMQKNLLTKKGEQQYALSQEIY